MDIKDTDTWKDGVKPQEKPERPLRKKHTLGKILPSASRSRYVTSGLPSVKVDKAARKLTPKQDQFARIYSTKSFEGISAAEAAILAGYGGKSKNRNSARVAASNMLNPRLSPHIVAAVRRYTEELTQQYSTSAARSLASLHRIRELSIDQNQLASAVAAEKARASIAGVLNSNISVKHTHSIDLMSITQVREELNKLNSNSEIIDVEASPEKNSPSLEQGVELLESD